MLKRGHFRAFFVTFSFEVAASQLIFEFYRVVEMHLEFHRLTFHYHSLTRYVSPPTSSAIPQ